MNLDTLRKYCLSMKGVTEDMPFDNITLVFKVMGKIFLLTDTEGDLWINLKCDPEKALETQSQLPCCSTRLSHEQKSIGIRCTVMVPWKIS